jgi:Protein of unknown function (DUF3034)
MLQKLTVYRLALAATLTFGSSVQASDGKLLGTSGLVSIEGSAGGGLTPWAVLGSYAEAEQLGFSASISNTHLRDYQLRTGALAFGVNNRVEFSAAQQRFELPRNAQLSQNVFGAKLRVSGDLIYGSAPQLAITLQHKRHQNTSQLSVLGVQQSTGTDVVFSASKLWINGAFSRNTLANVNFRRSAAQETGLLGFNDDSKWLAEAAVAILPNRYWAIGAEFRQKPDFDGLAESHWRDVFIAWFPKKGVSAALAYVDLGTIAGRDEQTGFFFTLQANF